MAFWDGLPTSLTGCEEERVKRRGVRLSKTQLVRLRKVVVRAHSWPDVLALVNSGLFHALSRLVDGGIPLCPWLVLHLRKQYSGEQDLSRDQAIRSSKVAGLLFDLLTAALLLSGRARQRAAPAASEEEHHASPPLPLDSREAGQEPLVRRSISDSAVSSMAAVQMPENPGSLHRSTSLQAASGQDVASPVASVEQVEQGQGAASVPEGGASCSC